MQLSCDPADPMYDFGEDRPGGRMQMTWRIAAGAAVGAAVGFLIYRTVGCRTGACPLTGNPYIAMAVYGLLGAILSAGR
jgi:hypothetical protein